MTQRTFNVDHPDGTTQETFKVLCTIRQFDLDKDHAEFEVAQRYGVETMQVSRYHFNYRLGWMVWVPVNWQAVERN
jgi:hypothetical protein